MRRRIFSAPFDLELNENSQGCGFRMKRLPSQNLERKW
jgi:hypothetical protein